MGRRKGGKDEGTDGGGKPDGKNQRRTAETRRKGELK